MLGTSLRANPLRHIVMQFSRYPELLQLYDVNGTPAFVTTPAVPASELVHRPLHLNGYWLPPVSYTQIPPDIELGGPIWD